MKSHTAELRSPGDAAAPATRGGPRIEDDALLQGRGRFADDLGVAANTLYAAVLRSPHPHAELVSVDASAALTMPGVRAVLTGEDVQRWSQPFVVGVKAPSRP